MARGQLPSLASVSEIPQGGLQDFQAIENHDGAAEAGGELVAQILGLLATFIGERLMLDIVLDEGPILCQIIWGLR